MQRAKIDSRPDATTISASSTTATALLAPASTQTAPAVVRTAPMPCAKRFGGPGTGRAAPRRGAITDVARLAQRAQRRAREHARDEAVCEHDE